MCIILYLLGSCYFLSRPALSNEMKEKVNRALSHTESFRLSLDANGMLDRQSFSTIMNKEDNFVLTPRESALIFDGVDTDGSGKITLEELKAFTSENQVKKPGMRDKLKRKKNQAEEKRDEMEEESGYAARDDIAEQRDLANEYADNLNGGDPNGDVNMFSLPSISLGEFPGLTLPDGVDMNFKLPSFKLGDFPGLDVIQMTLRDVGNIELPSIELGRFPDIELPDHISGNIQLPSTNVSEFPNVVLPRFKKLNIPNTNNMNMKLNIGGILMKLKLFLGFVQCVSFFPVTFGSVPFPTDFLNLGRFLQLFSIDLASLLGNACDFSTGYYASFMFSFILFPIVIGGALVSYGVIRLRQKLNPSKVNYTTESARTRLYSFLFFIVYSIYTGVATKMFILFKCEEIQGTWYLMADYRITCYDDEYNQYRTLAVLGILVYVFGILFGILGLLFYNKKYLHEANCPEDEMYKHLQMVKQFGSIYEDYTENNFYFDLVDLARRLLLTGGLILVGEQSNTQIFLGALLCVIWLMLVTVRRPYAAYWDNILSIVLSLQLVLIMLCGMALEMNRLTPGAASDPYEKRSFGVLMVGFSIFIIITAIAAIIVTIPCLRDFLMKIYIKRCNKEEEKENQQEKSTLMGGEGGSTKKPKKKRRLSHNTNPEIEMTEVSICNRPGGGNDKKLAEVEMKVTHMHTNPMKMNESSTGTDLIL